MKPIVAVTGPRDAGPGERQEMLDRARRALEQAGAEPATAVRVDVPGRGAGGGSDDAEAAPATLRPGLESLVPALQSGSLFADSQGVLVMEAHQLLKGEGEVVAELLAALGPGVVVVLVAAGKLPAPVARVVKERGDVISVKKLRERDAGEWLGRAARERGISLDKGAAAALLQRFGSDVAGMAQALDQLAMAEVPLTGEAIAQRFRNRPDEPVWLYADAVADGDVGEALRRLSDYLTHTHPLVLLAYLENDLRRRALAAAAPDIETFAEWVGSSSDQFPVKKAWRARSRTSDSELARALDAISRADQHLKSAPEETHRITMERLTVALCRWYGGPARRAG